MCGGGDAVKRVVFPRNFSHKDVDPCPSILGVCPVVELTGLGSLCLSKRGGVPRMCVDGDTELGQVMLAYTVLFLFSAKTLFFFFKLL